MGASPELFREVGRFASRCRLCFLPKPCFFRSVATIAPARAPQSLRRRAVTDHFSVLWAISFKITAWRHLLPVLGRCACST